MSVVSIQQNQYSVRLLSFIQHRMWDEILDALSNGASPHIPVLPQMCFFEAFLRHLAKPSMFKAPERIDEELIQRRVFRAFVSAWRQNDSTQKTPLTLTTIMGRPDLVEILLSAGHDPNEVGAGHSPLTALATPVLEEIPSPIKSQRKAMDMGWEHTVRPGQMSCMRLLLAGGADINACSWKGRTALELACLSKNVPCIVDLLNAGADPEGQTPEPLASPLEIAIDVHCELGVQALLRHGADPLRMWSQKPHTGLPIATAACVEGLTGMLAPIYELLGGFHHPALAAGWWLALDYGRSRIVDWFIDKGQDLFLRDDNGQTALHHAVISGQAFIINRLISLGLDLGDKDNNGVSCRDLFYQLHPEQARQVLGKRVGEPGNVVAFRARSQKAS